MPLPSFLQRGPKNADLDRRKAAPSASPDDPGPAQAARTRARRRLIGAVVLLAVGVVGFPLLFETQPRPIGVDVPIHTANGPQGSRAVVPPQPVGVAPLPRSQPAEPMRPPEDAGREQTAASTPAPTAPAVTTTAVPAAANAAASVAPRAAASAAAPRAAAPASAPRAADGARAQALLDGAAARRPVAASQPVDARASDDRAGRFVVQVGAYTDAGALREARARVEKLGLKTYTQVIETDAGKRTRVRVGPFEERGEADAAARKLKAAGLPANILAL